MSVAQSYTSPIRIGCGATHLDQAVAPVISENGVPEARRGCSGLGGRGRVDPLVERVEKGEEANYGLANVWIEGRMAHEGVRLPYLAVAFGCCI